MDQIHRASDDCGIVAKHICTIPAITFFARPKSNTDLHVSA
jgi:hypothetical protein